jgi:hypothetical protein
MVDEPRQHEINLVLTIARWQIEFIQAGAPLRGLAVKELAPHV